jgi:hypothetical protein
MDQGIKGIEIFFAGWMLALTAYFVGGLDTGAWIPLVVDGVGTLGLALVLAGLGKAPNKDGRIRAAKILFGLALAASLGMLALLYLSELGIRDWMGALAVALVFAGEILFVVGTGLAAGNLRNAIRNAGDEKVAGSLSYQWALFLTFVILFISSQAISILLVNESLRALTYLTPALGIPMLAMGMVMIVKLYQRLASGAGTAK